jgi:hypothetical protein
MNLRLRLGRMRTQPRTPPGARHGVPLIAQPAGIEAKWKSFAGRGPQLRKLRRDEAAASIAGEKSAVGEEALFAAFGACRQRPHHRVQQVIVRIGEVRETAQVEVAPPVIFERRQRRMLAKNIRRCPIGEGLREAEAAGHFGHDPPIGLRLAR